MEEFVYNNTQSASTKVSPFFANYGYHPRCTVMVTTDCVNPAAEDFTDRLKVVHEELALLLKAVQERYKSQFDTHTTPTLPFSVGDKVWFSRRNIKTKRPSRKLDVRRLGPFRILEAVRSGNLAFRLELPASIGRIHPVFHASLLEPYQASLWAGRMQELPPPVEVERELEYEVHEILDSKMERRRLFYLVDWVGYGPEERTWEPATNVEHTKNAVADFHRAHPRRPWPRDIPTPRRRPLLPPRAPARLQLPPTASNCLHLPSFDTKGQLHVPLQELRRRGDHLSQTNPTVRRSTAMYHVNS